MLFVLEHSMRIRRNFLLFALLTCVSIFAGSDDVPIFDSSRDASQIMGSIVEENYRAIWAMPISTASTKIPSE